jgi:transcriptional regulator with XRE-family HTH domain
MGQPRRGRPPNTVDPDASHGARLGFEIRTRRIELDLTLGEFGALTGYTAQYVSEVERAKATPAEPFIVACERALDAHGELEPLLPAALQEREQKRQERAAARRATDPSLRCEDHSEAVGDDEDVEPTNRRGLLGAGAAAALGTAAVSAAPTQARQIDPQLPMHWAELLCVMGRHDAMFGPRDVLAAVRRELGLITEHRKAARGELRVALLRVESRWAQLSAWLSHDTGLTRERDAWTDLALRLAQEADYADMIAFARMRQSQWASHRNVSRAVALAQDSLRTTSTSAQTRACCVRQAAHSYALANDAAASERYIADAYALVDEPSPAPPWAGEKVTQRHVQITEARAMLTLAPAKAVGLYDRALDDWPSDRARDGAAHRARLALACAAAGERDRARAEGRKALAIARSTHSGVIARELKRLGAELRAA